MEDPRSTLTPQMAVYDDAGQTWLPFLMFFQPPELCSEVLNTDRFGFRVTWKDGRPLRDLEVDPDLEVDLLVGGSTAFGVGASSDRRTLPSLLNKDSGRSVWLNFGGRAFFSTQEFLLFLFYHRRLPRIRRIVLLTGLNNLVIFRLASRYSRDFGTFFAADAFHRAMDNGQDGIPAARRLMRALLQPYFGDQIDYRTISLGELTGLLRGADRGEKTGRPDAGNARDMADLVFTWERDLANWRLFCRALDIRLCYVLQPFARWIDRPPAKEEELLFAALDREDPDWKRILEIDLERDQYAWYAGVLGELCRKLEVEFHDMNELLSRRELGGRWLFVDRVHLSDEGHRVVAEVLREEILGR